MWILAIFLLTGGQAQLTPADDLASCLAAYQAQTENGSVQPSNVERAMCTQTMPKGSVHWIVKPRSP